MANEIMQLTEDETAAFEACGAEGDEARRDIRERAIADRDAANAESIEILSADGVVLDVLPPEPS